MTASDRPPRDQGHAFSPDDDTVELLCTNAIEAEVIAARLRSEGIPAVVFGGGAYGGGPAVGEGAGVRVMVRRGDLEIATALTTDTAESE